MSVIISKLQVLKINSDVIVAPRKMSRGEIKQWYRQKTERDADYVETVSFIDKPRDSDDDYAHLIIDAGYEAEDLPAIL